MFKLQELSNLIETGLNQAGENFSPAYSFRIFTEIGKNTGSSYINCVLRQQKPSVSVVPNVINNTYILVLDVVVPANTVNFNIASVQEIFNGVIENINGKEQEFKDGKGIVTFTLADTGNFKTEYGQGNIVPISYNIFVNYAENVVLDKHYLLNGQEIPFTYDELLIEKDGVTKPIYGEKFQKSFATLQRKFFHFRMPKSTTIATNLIADILREEPNKEYTLTYYDGDIFTQQAPFTTKVEIFRTANARSQRPQTTELDITFAEVDDETSLTKYELALIDNQFDADSENTRYFESQGQQQAYFEDFVTNYGATWDRIKVPNLNSIDLTNQIYKNTNNYDLFDLVNKNYAIIKVTQNAGLTSEKVSYFYYFVNSAQIGLYNQVSYDLKLDTLQTYYYNENIEFNGTFINKAHLNRWIDNGDGTISFNGKADSYLFEREEIKQVAKRLVLREKLKLGNKYPQSVNLIKWINDNIMCWVYILVGTVPIKIKNIDDDTFINNYDLQTSYADYGIGTKINYGYKLLCYPLYKNFNESLTSRKIVITANNKNIILSENGFQSFLENNDGFSNVYSIKLSIKPPMHLFSTIYNSYEISETQQNLFISGNKLTSGQISLLEYDFTNPTDSIDRVLATGTPNVLNSYNGLFEILDDYIEPVYLTCDLTLPQIKFNKTDLQNANKNKLYNPKMNSVDYKELVLTFAGSQFVIDLQKLNSSTLNFKYNEMLTADVTKGILRLDIPDNPANRQKIFNPNYADSFNGFSFTNDLTLPFSTNAYDTYIANNKNAYLSFLNQQNYNTAMFTANTVTGFAKVMQNPLSIFGFGVDTAGNALKQGIQMAYDIAQFELSIDNMKNAPDSLSSANGNVLFISAVAEFGIYAEIYEGLNAELETANDIMHQNGFTYNRYGNVKNFDNIRKYFNYVQAVIGNIGGIPMSNVARNDLRQRFINGVRFWNTDEIDYSVENIEKSIILVYNVEYNITSDRVDLIYPRPSQIGYGVFETQIEKVSGYDYTDIQVTISIVKNGVTTPLSGNFMDNEGKITLDMTNSNYTNYFKDSLKENGDKILITISNV